MELIKKMKLVLVLIATSMLALANANTITDELKTDYGNTEIDIGSGVCADFGVVSNYFADLYVLRDLQFLRKSGLLDLNRYKLVAYKNPNIDNYIGSLPEYERVELNRDFKLLNKIYNTDRLSNYDISCTCNRQLKHKEKWQKKKKKRHLLYRTSR